MQTYYKNFLKRNANISSAHKFSDPKKQVLKIVINFMQMTENEIATFLHLNKGTKVCGAIHPKQQTQKYLR